MPPTLDHPSLNLILLNEPFLVHKLPAQDELPRDVLDIITRSARSSEFMSITRTSEEISIVCNAASLSNIDAPQWKCIKIKGPMDFGLIGIMCDFTTPLKHAGISIIALSTWNTDYILVPEAKVNDAVKVLKEDGWKFEHKDYVEA